MLGDFSKVLLGFFDQVVFLAAFVNFMYLVAAVALALCP
jgi:hypothetical protein